MLSKDEQKELLAIARRAVERVLHKSPIAPVIPSSGSLAFPGGAFVTLRLNGELRGCIGYVESPLSVAQVVAEVAVKAARDDPRFPAVTREELRDLVFEVSVLSPLRRVHDISEIRVGEHGLVLEFGGGRGLLLPQVAREHGWTREEFLDNTARKAGLAAGAWRGLHATLFVFSAEVFHEERES